jgi:hypothetical protein
MHFAGGETSAGRSGITWMMFLAVFIYGIEFQKKACKDAGFFLRGIRWFSVFAS